MAGSKLCSSSQESWLQVYHVLDSSGQVTGKSPLSASQAQLQFPRGQLSGHTASRMTQRYHDTAHVPAKRATHWFLIPLSLQKQEIKPPLHTLRLCLSLKP